MFHDCFRFIDLFKNNQIKFGPIEYFICLDILQAQYSQVQGIIEISGIMIMKIYSIQL